MTALPDPGSPLPSRYWSVASSSGGGTAYWSRRCTRYHPQPGSRPLDYEKAHANRLPVVQVLNSRLEALKNGAEPSGTIPDSMPEVRTAGDVPPAGPKTDAPPVNPPSHGNPANPAQPRQ
jgi:hypothetical protein